jgi:cell division protein FtsN
MNKQRGGTFLGFILGALVGLGLALGIAVYITKVPMPFMNKTAPRTSESAAAETQKNRDWNPNAGLSGKSAAKPAEVEPAAAPAPASSVPAAPAPELKGPAADPLGDLVRAKAEAAPKAVPAAAPVAVKPAAAPAAVTPAPAASATLPVSPAPVAASGGDPFNYFVQAGAYRTPEDAERQRVKMSLIGMQARVSEREQSGRMVYRVRLGPFDKKDDADKAKEKLDASGMEATLVRVQK